MKKLLPLLIVFGIVFFIGCTTEDVTNSISSGGNYVELSSIVSNPEAYVGKEITVKGTITFNYNVYDLGAGSIINEPSNAFNAGTDQWGNALYVLFEKDPQDNHNPFPTEVWEASGIFQRFDASVCTCTSWRSFNILESDKDWKCGGGSISGCENRTGLYYFLNLSGHPLKMISSTLR
jgi:hypothetical protein